VIVSSRTKTRISNEDVLTNRTLAERQRDCAESQPSKKELPIMTFPLIILWAVTGFAAVRLSYSYPNPDDPNPPKKWPWPGPSCLVCGGLGSLGGILGGWVYSQVFVPQDSVSLRSGVLAATTSIGAFMVARVVTDITGAIANRPR
jgi:hypothetical protein